MAVRRYAFGVTPRPSQDAALHDQRRLHCALWNAALEERETQWARECQRRGRGERRGLTCYDQAAGLKVLRRDDPRYAALSFDSLAMTLRRLDLAFKAFFRRAKGGAGKSSGYPRFRSAERYEGFGFRWKKGRPNGCDFVVTGEKTAKLRLKGVPGWIRCRGRFPTEPAKLLTGDVMWRAGRWWISICVEIDRARPIGNQEGEVRFDLVDSFAVVRAADGAHGSGPEDVIYVTADGRIVSRNHGVNTTSAEATPDSGTERGYNDLVEPRPQAEATPDSAIADLQRRMDRIKPNPGQKASHKYRELKRRKAKMQAKVARRRRESLHLWTTGLATRFGKIAVTKPASVKDATASGRGTERDWGAAVETKATLNRHVLSMAPATAIQMIEYKLAERGGLVEILDQPDAPVEVGNLIVAATTENRKLKRSIRNARRPQRRDRHGEAGARRRAVEGHDGEGSQLGGGE